MKTVKAYAILIGIIALFVAAATLLTFLIVPIPKAHAEEVKQKNIVAVITVGPFVMDREEARKVILRSVKVDTYEEYMLLYPYIVAEVEEEYKELLSVNPKMTNLPRNMNTCAYTGNMDR